MSDKMEDVKACEHVRLTMDEAAALVDAHCAAQRQTLFIAYHAISTLTHDQRTAVMASLRAKNSQPLESFILTYRESLSATILKHAVSNKKGESK